MPVIDDAHDESIETLTLTLSNAQNAAIDDATATGRIVNTDPMPAAWLARFGRTGATQVLGLLDARFDEARAPASQLTLGGRPVNLSGLRGATGSAAAGQGRPAGAHRAELTRRRRHTPTRRLSRTRPLGGLRHPRSPCAAAHRAGQTRALNQLRRTPTHSMSWRPGTPWTTPRGALLI